MRNFWNFRQASWLVSDNYKKLSRFFFLEWRAIKVKVLKHQSLLGHVINELVWTCRRGNRHKQKHFFESMAGVAGKCSSLERSLQFIENGQVSLFDCEWTIGWDFCYCLRNKGKHCAGLSLSMYRMFLTWCFYLNKSWWCLPTRRNIYSVRS